MTKRYLHTGMVLFTFLFYWPVASADNSLGAAFGAAGVLGSLVFTYWLYRALKGMFDTLVDQF